MRCPFCDTNDNGVVDSRMTEDGRAIRRRRKCASCSGRFTTYERIEEMPLYVVKKDMRRQLFDRHKIVKGMIKACEKRPVATSTIGAAAAGFIARAAELGEKEIDSMGWRANNENASHHGRGGFCFASVYRSFRDVDNCSRTGTPKRR